MKPLLKFSTGVVIVIALVLQTGSAFALVPHAAGTTRIVDDDGEDCPDAGYFSIRAAVTDSAPGDTIIVCSGIYNNDSELLIASKSGLKLIGRGSPEIGGDSSERAGILVEDSQDVTIQGLVIGVPGWYFLPTNTEITGISFWNSSGTISNNIIRSFRPETVSSASSGKGVGIRVYGWQTPTPAQVKILNNTITDIHFAGIWVENAAPLAYSDSPVGYVPTISGNLIHTLATNAGVDFTSGIRLDWVMAGSVSKNLIIANPVFPFGYGIYMQNPARLKISGNTIKTFCIGMHADAHSAYLISKNTITNNQIIDGRCMGIFFGGKFGGPQIKDNRIQGNKIILKTSPGADGITFTASEDDDMVSGNKITGNTIQGYDDPITIDGDDGVTVSGNKVSPLITPGT